VCIKAEAFEKATPKTKIVNNFALHRYQYFIYFISDGKIASFPLFIELWPTLSRNNLVDNPLHLEAASRDKRR
jgi:hypothetical protein